MMYTLFYVYLHKYLYWCCLFLHVDSSYQLVSFLFRLRTSFSIFYKIGLLAMNSLCVVNIKYLVDRGCFFFQYFAYAILLPSGLPCNVQPLVPLLNFVVVILIYLFIFYLKDQLPWGRLDKYILMVSQKLFTCCA